MVAEFPVRTLLSRSHHSFSIAFKPAESGWGAGKKYTDNFDNIFGKKKPSAKPEEGTPSQEVTNDAADK